MIQKRLIIKHRIILVTQSIGLTKMRYLLLGACIFYMQNKCFAQPVSFPSSLCTTNVNWKDPDYLNQLFNITWQLKWEIKDKCSAINIENPEKDVFNYRIKFDREKYYILPSSTGFTFKRTSRDPATFDLVLKNNFFNDSYIRIKILNMTKDVLLIERWEGTKRNSKRIKYTKIDTLAYVRV